MRHGTCSVLRLFSQKGQGFEWNMLEQRDRAEHPALERHNQMRLQRDKSELGKGCGEQRGHP